LLLSSVICRENKTMTGWKKWKWTKTRKWMMQVCDALKFSSLERSSSHEYLDPNHRGNAILFNGSPIANLPTARLFAYATHFDAHPMGLEWVDDQTCVFVFPSKKDAREAFTRLTKPAHATADAEVVPMSLDDPADSSFIPAKPFPIALWPPEERINQTLGKGQGLKGPIRMRWARLDDVKKKGAKQQSQFYRKHGDSAGKELFDGRDLPPTKRKREWSVEDEDMKRKALDDELDEFLAADDRDTPDGADEHDDDSRSRKRARRPSRSRSRARSEVTPPVPGSPPSKMRSDYIGNDGRTLLERTSLRVRPSLASDPLDDRPDLASRLTAPLPRRANGRTRGEGRPPLHDRLHPADSERLYRDRTDDGLRTRERRRGGRNGREREGTDGPGGRKPRGERTAERPHKTQQELDDELDAFLNNKE